MRHLGAGEVLHAFREVPHVHSYMFPASQLHIWSQDFLSEQHLSFFCHNLFVLMADRFTVAFSVIAKPT